MTKNGGAAMAEDDEEKRQQSSSRKYETTPLRWAILALFVLYSTSNAFQWTQLVIITTILESYYDVSTLQVSWTSMIYMITYIPLIFPASWFLQEKVLINLRQRGIEEEKKTFLFAF